MIPTREEILLVLRENKERLVNKYGITKLGLFGSFARGEATNESDVDLCFDTARAEPFIATHLKEEFENILHRSVDIVQPHRFMRALFLKRLEQEVIYV
jgi:predicted nucleotidyltransferase